VKLREESLQAMPFNQGNACSADTPHMPRPYIMMFELVAEPGSVSVYIYHTDIPEAVAQAHPSQALLQECAVEAGQQRLYRPLPPVVFVG
jgi:hypothetical protein